LILAILFVAAVATMYVLAALVILRLIRRRRSITRISVGDRIILGVAAVGVACMLYGRFIEPNWLATTYITIHSSKIPTGNRSIRIVHFSDLHSEPRPRMEPKLVEAVAAAHPDVIVFTGDSLNSSSALRVFRDSISALTKIAPTYVVRGNWDTSDWSRLDLFGNTGAKELNGDAVRIQVDGIPVWIAGVANGNFSRLATSFGRIPPDEFSVFLYHSPDLMPEVAAKHIDLYCAGHTHGGQVALPLYGAMVTLSKYGKRYEAGLYHENDTWLYVNRGIGMDGGFAPRVRFWSRPELTVIDVMPAA
jgi:predicted MPP superfamily phosphohydrolase